MVKAYNKYNFHKHTFCIFKEVNATEVNALELSYKSKSGSSYYFTKKGVFRISNHWGRAANCRWRLIALSEDAKNNQVYKVGFASWTSFYVNNEHEKLFYIEVDWENKEVTFQHKDSSNFLGTEPLRNAAETAKRIQVIKEILATTNWSKYLKFDDFELIQKEIVTKLLETNETFINIKKEFL